MSKIQRTKGSGRLSERQLQFIGKIAATGRRHPQTRGFYVFLLVGTLLLFYFLSFCKKNAFLLSASVCIVLFVVLFYISMTLTGEPETPDRDLRTLYRQQKMFIALKDESYTDSSSGEQEEAFIAALMEENPDTVGWLSIPGTEIDYPVMQTPEDENYYLYRDFEGNENQNGSLLVSAGCDIEDENTNWIIHGHNMKSGAMFGSLPNYSQKSYMKDHRLIYLDTLDGRRTYEVIAVFESQVYYETDHVFKYYHCYSIESWEEFDSFYTNIKRLSLYDTGVDAVYGDHFLTLSTCSYHTENGRFVVVAKELY